MTTRKVISKSAVSALLRENVKRHAESNQFDLGLVAKNVSASIDVLNVGGSGSGCSSCCSQCHTNGGFVL
jgi:hypothetical protein